MKLLTAWCLVLTASFLVSGKDLRAESEANYERSLYATSFDQVDWSSLTAIAGSRAESEVELQQLCERNLKYIYHHKLNRRRFLVAPKPQVVVDRIVGILEASERLTGLLLRARGLLSRDALSADNRLLVQQVGRTARELRSQFTDYFLESHASAHTFQVPRSGDPAAQFSAFLLQSHRINLELSRRLDDYFFDGSPGAIRLDQMQSSNISALAESLEVLAGVVNRSLR